MKHFCMAPFVHIQRNSYGEFNPCCMFSSRIYKDHTSLASAFNSNENKLLRDKMLNDEYIEGCKKCYRDESLGKKSYRQRFNKRYGRDLIDNPKIKELEIALSNKCNFKCVDCNTKFSSSWYEDDLLLGRTYNTFKGQNVKTEIFDDDFDLLELKEIKILGGEPFLDDRYLDIFKKIDKKNITLFLVTNNSIFPKKEWIQEIKQFNFVNFNISVDGINDMAEFARYGTKFSKFEKNFKRWIELDLKNIKIVPHFVFHSLNFLNFDDTVNWLSEIYDKSTDHILESVLSYDFLSQPKLLNASFLSQKCKNHILQNSVYFTDRKTNFLNTNVYDSNVTKELLSYSNFLNLRSELPKQTLEILKCLK